uniref:YABBY protein C-terminal domain-containing protein n=1 Tax=Ananas comosus var. bracteatus TaxID=296719 RepID=A0A6V7PZV3_ANACO|nr:unnamed protein product [Ananas comosus var. bracteatus]
MVQGEIPYPPPPSLVLDQPNVTSLSNNNGAATSVRGREDQELPQNPVVINRAPEKRQRVPSAYNRFIKDEIQRIKAGNPDISHREAFSAAAKNWAYFPHIHFGLMPNNQSLKKPSICPQQGVRMFFSRTGSTPPLQRTWESLHSRAR